MDGDTERLVAEYEAEAPRFDDWQDATCVGYFGYGTGRGAAFAKAVADATGKDQQVPCNSCPVKQECWDQAKVRAHTLFPVSVDAFEKMARTSYAGRS